MTGSVPRVKLPLIFLAVASVYWLTKFSPAIPIVSVALFVGCFLLAILAGRKLDASTVRFAMGLFTLNLVWFAASLWFNPLRLGMDEIARSALQNAFYILLAPLIASMLPRLEKGRVAVRSTVVVIVALLSLCVLERAGVLNFDGVRRALFWKGMLYENNARDIALVGYIRPKLVASEPSLVASWIAMIAIVARTFGASRWLLAVTSAGGWFVIGSPYAFLPLLAAVLPRARSARGLGSSLPVVLGAVLLAYGLLMALVTLSGGGLPIRDESDYRRLILPVELAIEAVRQNPLIGYGMGSWDHLGEAGGPVSSGVFMPFVAMHQGGLLGLIMITLIVRRYIASMGLLFGGGVVLVLSVILGNPYGSSLLYIIVLERVFRLAEIFRGESGQRLPEPVSGLPAKGTQLPPPLKA
jgi:hypothetical protein